MRIKEKYSTYFLERILKRFRQSFFSKLIIANNLICIIFIMALTATSAFSQVNPTDACGAGVATLVSNPACVVNNYTLAGSYADGGVVSASCVSGQDRDDGWYQFVATSANTKIDLTGDEDRVLAVYTGSCGTGELACDMQAAGTTASVIVSTTIGNIYYIQVHRRSGNNTATMSGTICVSEFSLENSIHFDGIDDYVDCGTDASLDLTSNAITIEAWIYPTSFRSNVWEGCVINKSGGTGNHGYMLRVGNGGQVNFNLGDGVWNELYSSIGAVNLNNWHHIAGTYDGTTMRLYVDGTEVDTQSWSQNIGSSSNSLFLGSDPMNSSREFPGRIDEVKIWNTCRTASEVIDDMNFYGCTPLTSGLVAYYRFNQGTADANNAGLTTVIDETGTNNGTLNSSALNGTTSNWVAGNVVSAPSSMTYSSCTAAQPTITDVVQSDTDQEIIRIEVVTTGSCSPIDLTEIITRIDGTSTNADIANAKLWYTGISSTFATTSQFGATIAAPPTLGNDMTFSGTQTLATGANYFWLTYDIQAGATINNVVDAILQQITVNGSNETPSTSDPAGNRQIALSPDIAWPGLDVGSLGCPASTTVSDNTTGANTDCTVSSAGDHIYQFTTTIQSDVTVDVCGATWDTEIHLFDLANGDCNSGPIASNDDGCGSQSTITQNLIAGTYVVVVEGSWTEEGAYDLNITTSNCATAMTFVSCTTTQSNTNNTSPGTVNQEIVGIEVEMDGILSPLDLTEIITRIDGTTTNADIENAQLWYTGTSNAFATTTQFGATIATPPIAGNDMTFSGTQTLADGTNYFWLTYDIKAGATVNNVVDAILQQITVDGSNETPVSSAPAGNRQIVLSPDIAWPGLNVGSLGCPTTTTVSGNTTGANTDCVVSSAGDHIYQFTTTVQSDVTVDVCGATWDTQIHLFDLSNGDCDSGPIASDDDGCGSQSTITQNLVAGTYVVIVEGYSSNEGAYDLNITTSNCATAMTFVSCTSTQANTSDISIGTVNQEIIGVEIETSGSLTPLDLTRLTIRTDGTDSYSTDITSVNIWYTGTSSSFTTSNLFGTTQTAIAPGNDIAFTGTQQLEPGTNYFWVTYDIPSGATAGNYVDAIFQSVFVGGSTETPVVSDPGTGRQLLSGCYYNLLLEDSDSDGWEGGTLSVLVDGTNVLTDETCSGSSSTFSFVAETGSTISTTYTSGANSGENSYLITNPNGAYVLSSGEASTTPTNETSTADCDAVKKFTMNGDSYHYDDLGFIITEDEASQSGSIWSNYKIDLTEDFTIKFDIYLGDGDGGADGSAFVLQGSCTSAGGSGSSLGYGGINNSLVVEFDTYDNGGNSDPSNDHIGVLKNGDPDHWSGNLTAEYDSGGNIADDSWHSVEINWTTALDSLAVSWDGSNILNYTGDIVTDLFAGDSQVFWGFTGGTGALTNLQKVLVTEYPSNSTELTDITIDFGDSVNPEASTGATSYTWLPNDGSVSDPSVFNPSLTPNVTTEYTCLIQDGCGNVVTNKFTITVNNSLPVELIEFDAICNDEGVNVSWSSVSEINNDYYILQTSEDYITWQTVAKVYGVGNSNLLQHYQYLDDVSNRQLRYYKLSQVDFNGRSETISIINVNCPLSSGISVYPNPIDKVVFFDANWNELSDIQVYIFNQIGQCVFNRIYTSSELQDNLLKLDLSDYKSGIYSLKIFSGTKVYNEKLIKK